jgi:hypothetical protein
VGYEPSIYELTAARSLWLSGSLQRRVGKLRRVVPKDPVWARAELGERVVNTDLIHRLLSDVEDHGKAGRWFAAKQAFDAAERLVHDAMPTLRAVRLRTKAAVAEPFRRGRRPGSGDALRRTLLEILEKDRRQPSKDVLAALRKRKGQPPIVKVEDDPKKGAVVVWLDSRMNEKRTTWRSLRDGGRLSRLFKPVRKSRKRVRKSRTS